MVVNEIKTVKISLTEEEIKAINKAYFLVAELLNSMVKARCTEIICNEYGNDMSFNEAEIEEAKAFLYWLDKIEEMY